MGAQTKTELLADQDVIDMDAFGQLMELDEDDDSSFSETLTLDFFEQASKTFKEMDENLSVYLRSNYCVIFLPTLCWYSEKPKMLNDSASSLIS